MPIHTKMFSSIHTYCLGDDLDKYNWAGLVGLFGGEVVVVVVVSGSIWVGRLGLPVAVPGITCSADMGVEKDLGRLRFATAPFHDQKP